MKREIVVITGCSGAGKTTAARVLEDIGFFVVDNLPPQFLEGLLKLSEKNESKMAKIALIIDVREADFLGVFIKKWLLIDDKKYHKRIIFLRAKLPILISRYQETKRLHPLDDGCGINKAVEKEYDLLKPISEIATDFIDTDDLTSHNLKLLIKDKLFSKRLKLAVTLLSFGFKNGLPLGLDLCFDVRFLENPYYYEKLKPQTGKDKEVYDFVMNQENAKIFFTKIVSLIEFLYPLHVKEGKASLTIAIGCTGGKHRSVAMVQALYETLSKQIPNMRMEHRDV